MFPVGLYGTLLAGLIGITFPELLAPVENAARAIVCLPLRAYSIVLDEQPVRAAGRTTPGPEREALFAGQATAVRRAARGPAGFVPRVCRVIARGRASGGAIDELVLGTRADLLQACAPLVTAGGVLLGFLDTSAGAEGAARVRLLAFRPREARGEAATLRVGDPIGPGRVAAEVRCTEAEVPGLLRFLVEPARAVDDWPLRCSLLDDPYLASRLRRSGDLITTAARGNPPWLPAGLEIGRLMIWGYPDLDIPVGLFVQPERRPASISAVVLWYPAAHPPAPPAELAPEGRRLPVRFVCYPAPRPVGQRWLVTSPAGTILPDGAALVEDDRLIGTLRRPWTGQSLVAPFGSEGRLWALLLKDAAGAVHELAGRVIGRAGEVELDLAIDGGVVLPHGEMFTGANGRHCPAGFRLGRFRPTTPGRGVLSRSGGAIADPFVFLGQEGRVR